MGLVCLFKGHDWHKLERLEGKCQAVEECERCKELRLVSVPHTFGGWMYIAEDNCNQERTCTRCGVTQRRNDIHQWGDVLDGKRTCAHCRKEIYEVVYDDDDSDSDDEDWDDYDNDMKGYSSHVMFSGLPR